MFPSNRLRGQLSGSGGRRPAAHCAASPRGRREPTEMGPPCLPDGESEGGDRGQDSAAVARAGRCRPVHPECGPVRADAQRRSQRLARIRAAQESRRAASPAVTTKLRGSVQPRSAKAVEDAAPRLVDRIPPARGRCSSRRNRPPSSGLREPRPRGPPRPRRRARRSSPRSRRAATRVTRRTVARPRPGRRPAGPRPQSAPGRSRSRRGGRDGAARRRRGGPGRRRGWPGRRRAASGTPELGGGLLAGRAALARTGRR